MSARRGCTARHVEQADVERLGEGNIGLVTQIAALNRELEAEKGTVAALGAAVQAHKEAAAQMRAAENVLRERLVNSADLARLANEDVASRDAIIVDHQAELQRARNDLVVANAKINSQEAMRRRMHNTIQDLKGNIRVFCRVRPSKEAGCIEVDKAAVEPKVPHPTPPCLSRCHTKSRNVTTAKPNPHHYCRYCPSLILIPENATRARRP